MNYSKYCAFTICTRSYLGLALTLKKSFMKFNEGFDFKIIFADYSEESKEVDGVIDAKMVVGSDDGDYLSMAFKYNLTEMCTAIKPFGFRYLFARGYEKVLYFDPDILFFSRFDDVYSEYSVYLTPHILKMFPKDDGAWTDETFLNFGIFNCGFVGLANDKYGNDISKWWANVLKEKAYSDVEDGLYTDQKWMDLIPALIPNDRINIIKNPGCDVAPWNFAERKIEQVSGSLYVIDRDGENVIQKSQLCFVHYSSYSYKKLLSDDFEIVGYNMKHYLDTDVLLKMYREALKENHTLQYLSIKYKYNYFENGKVISPLNRRLYRESLNRQENYGNPFCVEAGSFYSLLKRKKLLSSQAAGKIDKSSIKDLSAKNQMIDKLFYMLFKFIGVDKYDALIRKLKKMWRYENHYFLLGDDNDR